jgi:hypothetical protein
MRLTEAAADRIKAVMANADHPIAACASASRTAAAPA